MAFKLIWSPTAKFDLKDIAAFIAEDNVTAAERFVGSLFQAVERLADFPESGRMVPEFGDPAIREVIHKPVSGNALRTLRNLLKRYRRITLNCLRLIPRTHLSISKKLVSFGQCELE